MNGSTNRELVKAMINDRQREARREAEPARLVSEARAAARDDQDGGARRTRAARSWHGSSLTASPIPPPRRARGRTTRRRRTPCSPRLGASATMPGSAGQYSMLATFHAEFGSNDQVLTERYLALEHFDRAGDLAGQANAHMFASDALCTGRFRYGTVLWDDLSDPEVRRRASDGLAHAERALALYRQRLGDTETARGCCEQASELARDIGDPQGQLFARHMLGRVYQAAGDLEGAIGCSLEALDIEPDGGPASHGTRRNAWQSWGNVSGRRRSAVGAPGLAARPGAVREPAPPGRRPDARPAGPVTRISGTSGRMNGRCATTRWG